MKVGIICEGGPDSADKKVCEHLARMLQPDIEISSVPLGNKPNLVEECGRTAVQLLADGCERIVIVWDLHPAWREKKQPPCRKEDRAAIMESLAKAEVTSPHVYLVCIEEELEAWLLADGRSISAVLSRKTHPVTVKDKKNPERIQNPKKQLNQIFQEKTGRPYIDSQYAERIIKKVDLNKLRCCNTFVRFAEKVTGRKL